MREEEASVETAATGTSSEDVNLSHVRSAIPSLTRHRKLHLGHFAFMRAVVQGLDTRDSWDRYLRLEGEHDDVRNVRRTIQWMRRCR